MSCFRFFFFWPHWAACGNPSSLTRDWTRALGSESNTSQPLDRQGIPQVSVFIFFGQIPRSWIARSSGSSSLNFLKKLHTIFHKGCTPHFFLILSCVFSTCKYQPTDKELVRAKARKKGKLSGRLHGLASPLAPGFCLSPVPTTILIIWGFLLPL